MMQTQTLCLKEADEKTSEITLKGSVDIVSDFFFTAINSILYQRGSCRKEIQFLLVTLDSSLTDVYSSILLGRHLRTGNIQT